MSRKRVRWSEGDIFVIELNDGTYINGQILDLQMKNVVRCALFNERENNIRPIELCCQQNNLISLIATTREQLDYGIWEIIGNKEIEINRVEYPNEQFRGNGWIGAKIYDASIIEEFVEAFYALTPWDNWADPNYLDKLLYDINLKPANIILSRTK